MYGAFQQLFSVNAVGWTLVHSVWLGVACWIVHVLLQHVLRRWDSNVRYLAACACLLLLVGALALAWVLAAGASDFGRPWFGASAGQTLTILPNGKIKMPEAPAAVPWLRWLASLDGWLPYVVWLWTAGIALHLLWTARAVAVLHRQASRAPLIESEPLLEAFSRLCQRLLPGRVVMLRQTTLVRVPATFGWLKPVVLLPFGLIGPMSVHELECILAHEMAHVRRRDYLINLVQSFVETALFFHPLVRRVSASIRVLREECCDDLAIDALDGQRKAYATALVKFEKIRGGRPTVTMQLTGDGSVADRVERLVRQKSQSPRRGYLHLLGALVAIAVCGSTAMGFVRAQIEEQELFAFAESHSLGDSIYRLLGADAMDNPEMADAVTLAHQRTRNRRQLTRSEAHELADVLIRGGSPKTLLYAMAPSMGAASSGRPIPGSPWKGGSSPHWHTISRELHRNARESADPAERRKLSRAAVLLAAQDGIDNVSPFLRGTLREPEFERELGLSSATLHRLRQLFVIADQRRNAMRDDLLRWEADPGSPLPTSLLQGAQVESFYGWYLLNWLGRNDPSTPGYAQVQDAVDRLPYRFGQETRPMQPGITVISMEEAQQRRINPARAGQMFPLPTTRPR